MAASTLQKLLSGVAFFLAFSVCSAAPPPGPYPGSSKSTRTSVTVHVVWLPSIRAVNAVCTFLIEQQSGIVGCFNPQTMTIYAVEPRNFNDDFYLEILGHEFWHALGAQHPEL